MSQENGQALTPCDHPDGWSDRGKGDDRWQECWLCGEQRERTPSWEELLADPSLTFGEPGELLPHLLNFGKCYCAAAHVGPCGPPTAPASTPSPGASR